MSDALSKDTALKWAIMIVMALAAWWQSMIVSALRDASGDIQLLQNKDAIHMAEISRISAELEFYREWFTKVVDPTDAE